MKRISTIFAVFILFSSLAIGCERASLNRIGKDVYYVQIKGEGKVEEVEGHTLRNYTLPAYDENGVKKKVTFRSKKSSKDKKLNENAFLCLYVSQDDENKTEVSSTEVKSYEEIQKDDLPSKVKEKLDAK
ncbi:YxeA family protein [Bacillus cereus group sp. BfR-BA-01383]|uniref:YxeA family protein n=1 Tax=Bacillus cereus group sp. BfR-BA-01383 TaxID=2920327 RepID=UPI001F59F883|nr:YxeA family protein [Bacillus cereus group sp. BfR-BA-01383]